MKSPLPILLIGAAFLLMRGKKGSGGAKDNLLKVTANSAIPIIPGPYIQVTSSFAPDAITIDDLEDVVRPISEQNTDIKFIISAADGLDRLKMAQHADINTPDQFTVTAMHGQSDAAMSETLSGDGVTLTNLQEKVVAALAYMRAPYTPGA